MLNFRLRRAGVVGLCLIVLTWLSLPTAARSAAPAEAKPKLIVMVVFDQLRGDYLERFGPYFGKEGFYRLTHDGAWFTNCHYPYAVTKTGAGHASLATGASPDRHGIISNDWYDRQTQDTANCVGSERYEQVPPRPAKPKSDDKDKKKVIEGVSPETLKAPTVADALKKATGGKARVVALSFKDRSAVLPGGMKADACYWLDTTTGQFVTSTYYRDRVHPWVEAFNARKPADAWMGKDWTPLNPKLDFKKLCKKSPIERDDDAEGDEPFRRSIPVITKSLYYKTLYLTPFGNDLLLQLMKEAITGEKLGTRDVTDLLCVSFSCNDAIGHAWGPDSAEVLDVTLRSDLIMKELLTFLDDKVGKGKYTLVLSADHGICPLPEISKADGLKAGRLPTTLLGTDANDFLRETFGKADDKARWVEGKSEPWVYLNQALLKTRGLESADIEKALAKWYEEQPGILKAYTRTQLLKGVADDDVIGKSVLRSFYPDRAGDVLVVLKPYYLISVPLAGGTNHGTPHSYDTHVPLLAYGPGIRAGVFKERVTPQACAAILSKAAGIDPPARCEAPVPESLK
jgi:hypothetical protein